jgi:hypothetical protein
MSRYGLLGKWILGAVVLAAAAARPAAAQQEPCGVSALCLGAGRYQFFLFWYDAATESQHVANPVTLSDGSGYFWFFDPGNVEVTAKALDGCAENGHEWIFMAGMTTMRVQVRVTDLLTGFQKNIDNLQGSVFQAVVDTTTFPSCPGTSEGPVSGEWTGMFTSADFVDCDPPAPATATFVQNGSVVTGTLDAPNVFCGPNHVEFSGTLDGDTLTGVVSGRDYGKENYSGARVFGTLTSSGTQLTLTIVNGFGLIPGGVLNLHR